MLVAHLNPVHLKVWRASPGPEVCLCWLPGLDLTAQKAPCGASAGLLLGEGAMQCDRPTGAVLPARQGDASPHDSTRCGAEGRPRALRGDSRVGHSGKPAAA